MANNLNAEDKALLEGVPDDEEDKEQGVPHDDENMDEVPVDDDEEPVDDDEDKAEAEAKAD